MEYKQNRFNKRNDRRNQVTEIDVDHVIRYLTRQFRQRTDDLGRDAGRGTDLYKLQVDFTYLVDEIKRGPSYQASKVIAQANDFLDSIEAK